MIQRFVFICYWTYLANSSVFQVGVEIVAIPPFFDWIGGRLSYDWKDLSRTVRPFFELFVVTNHMGAAL